MTQCLMTKYVEGYIEPLPSAEPECWEDVLDCVYSVMPISAIYGYAPYTHLYQVDFRTHSNYYMVDHS